MTMIMENRKQEKAKDDGKTIQQYYHDEIENFKYFGQMREFTDTDGAKIWL